MNNIKRAFMPAALGLAALLPSQASAQYLPRVPGYNGAQAEMGRRDETQTDRDEQDVYNLGRRYAEENYDRLVRVSPYDYNGAYNSGSVDTSIAHVAHPYRYVGNGGRQILGDLGMTPGNSIARAQSASRADQIMAPKVIAAIDFEDRAYAAEKNGQRELSDNYHQQADNLYLEIGERLDRNQARNNAGYTRMLERAGSRAFQRHVTHGDSNIVGHALEKLFRPR